MGRDGFLKRPSHLVGMVRNRAINGRNREVPSYNWNASATASSFHNRDAVLSLCSSWESVVVPAALVMITTAALC